MSPFAEIAAIVVGVLDGADGGVAGQRFEFVVDDAAGGDAVLDACRSVSRMRRGEGGARGDGRLGDRGGAGALLPTDQRVLGEGALPEEIAADAAVGQVEGDGAGVEQLLERERVGVAQNVLEVGGGTGAEKVRRIGAAKQPRRARRDRDGRCRARADRTRAARTGR